MNWRLSLIFSLGVLSAFAQPIPPACGRSCECSTPLASGTAGQTCVTGTSQYLCHTTGPCSVAGDWTLIGPSSASPWVRTGTTISPTNAGDSVAIGTTVLGGTVVGTIGTAAIAATGTSGHTVPFLDGVNTWSGVQKFPTGSYVNGSAGLGDFLVASSLTTTPRGIVSGQWSTSADSAQFSGYKARGTQASPATVVTGDFIARWSGFAYDGTTYNECSSIIGSVQGTVASTRTPGQIDFYTCTDAAPSVLTDRMTIDKAGNVGIGTTTIGSRLTIQGAGATSATSALNVTDSAGSSKLFVRNDGNVGIGTTSPGELLDINTGLTGHIGLGLNLTYPSTLNIVSLNGGMTNGSVVGLSGGGTGKELNFQVPTGGTFSFAINGLGNQVIVIDTNGKVGIGTISPAYRLDVALSGGSGTARFKDTTATTGATRVLMDLGAADSASTNIFTVAGSQTMAGSLSLTSAAAATVSSGQVSFGATTAVVANCGSLATACLVINVAGTTRYIPYF